MAINVDIDVICNNVPSTFIHRICAAFHPHFKVTAVNMPAGMEVGFVTQNSFGCSISLF